MIIDLIQIAKLARLHLNEDKVAEFTKQMQDIMSMVDDLPLLEDMTDHPQMDESMSLRPDEIVCSFSRDELLQNAPAKQAGCILVPRTLQD